MKKIAVLMIVPLVLILSSTPGFAFGIGVRAMGMGGAYTALARDITAAYWNPAGLIHAGLLAGDVMLGAGYDGNVGLEQLSPLMNPEKFIEDSWNNNINYNLNANGILGGSIRGIGISYIPWAGMSVVKPPAPAGGTPSVNFDGKLKHAVAVTFGKKCASPIPLLSPLSLGANVRYVNGQLWRVRHAGGLAPAPVYVTDATGNGIGLDLGAQADIIPNVTLGLVLRDLLTGFTWSGKTKEYAGLDENTGTLQGSPTETDFSETESLPSHIVLGVAAKIPFISTLAADLDYYSDDAGGHTDTHLGAELGLIPGMFTPRIGYYTEGGGATSKTTAGLGTSIGPLHADFASGWDNVNTANKFFVFSISGAM